MRKLLFAIFFIFSVLDLSFSQNDTVYNFMIPSCRIHQNENGKKVFYEFEKDWNLVTVNDSFLIADPNKYSYKVNLRDVNRISYHYGSNPGNAAIFAGSIGFFLGFITGGYGIKMESSSDGFSISKGLFGGCAGGLFFGLIGAAISSAFSSYDNYDFYNKNLTVKREKIINSLLKNRIKK